MNDPAHAPPNFRLEGAPTRNQRLNSIRHFFIRRSQQVRKVLAKQEPNYPKGIISDNLYNQLYDEADNINPIEEIEQPIGPGVAPRGFNPEVDNADDAIFNNFIAESLPSRKVINKLTKNMKVLTAHERLLNFLRVKYFMKRRDINTLNNMTSDARVWMLKNKYSCESSTHYDILTSSVTTAFMVTTQELQFRALLKDNIVYENMVHLNATLNGDLGKTYLGLRGAAGHAGESVGRNLLPNLTMPKSPAII